MISHARLPHPFLCNRYPNANPDALDLLEKLLEFDPADRCTVEEALAHPYLKALHFPEDEPSGQPVNRADFQFERTYLSSEEIRELILREITTQYVCARIT
jgi:serine/threonine protein kinase